MRKRWEKRSEEEREKRNEEERGRRGMRKRWGEEE